MTPTLTLEPCGLWRATFAGQVFWSEFRTSAALWLTSVGAFE